MHLPPVVTCTEVLQKPFNAKSTSVTPELIYRHPPPPKKNMASHKENSSS